MADRLAQAAALARIQQAHPRLRRLADEHPVRDQCLTGAVGYECPGCRMIVTVEPDGHVDTWEYVQDSDDV